MKKNPSYTVIIPTHLRPVLLKRALLSIKNQTDKTSVQIIVISDKSDIATDMICNSILEDNDIYIRRNGTTGPALSRNLGIKMSTGNVILFLDDDDAWQPNLIEELQKCPNLKQGNSIYFNSTVRKEKRHQDGPIQISEYFVNLRDRLNENILIKNQIPICCYAFPSNSIKGIEFDTHMKAYEDWDFILAALEIQMPIYSDIQGAIIHEVDDETSDRRGNSSEAQNLNAISEYLYVYKRHESDEIIKNKRALFISNAGLTVPSFLL